MVKNFNGEIFNITEQWEFISLELEKVGPQY